MSSDLDAAIRARLAKRPSVFPGMSETMREYHRQRFDEMADALLAVLDLHTDDGLGFCRECSDEFPVTADCPTWLAIAKKLGVEAVND